MINNQKNMYQPYGGLSREQVLEIYEFVVKLRNKEKIGQTKITKRIKEKFGVCISENTVSGWIHRKIIPYANEKTQFKPKPVPPKKVLYDLYVNRKISASKLALKFNVSTIIMINWIKNYGIKLRSHLQSMNTTLIKKELRDKRLTKPIKNYNHLTPEKAYILGVLCGDAHINKKLIRLEIRKDVEFIEKFAKCFEEVYGIKYKHYYYPRKNTYILHVTSEIISKDLMSYSDFRTFTWRAPKEILESNDRELITNFLRGMYDSEGSASKYVIKLGCKNKTGIEEISSLLSKINIKNSFKHYERCSTVYITHKNNLQKFKKEIGFTIKRKNDKL